MRHILACSQALPPNDCTMFVRSCSALIEVGVIALKYGTLALLCELFNRGNEVLLTLNVSGGGLAF